MCNKSFVILGKALCDNWMYMKLGAQEIYSIALLNAHMKVNSLFLADSLPIQLEVI